MRRRLVVRGPHNCRPAQGPGLTSRHSTDEHAYNGCKTMTTGHGRNGPMRPSMIKAATVLAMLKNVFECGGKGETLCRLRLPGNRCIGWT